MLNLEDIVPMMLKACPSAREAWSEHLEWWEGEKAGDYNDIAVFSHHIVHCFKTGNEKEIKAAFKTIEKLINEGSDDVRGVAVVGFLEGVQNISSHEDFGYSVFEPYLHSSSKQGWYELIELWKGKNTLADVIRAQKQNN
ncbi:MAG: hypothetical protein BalsKO_29340 [Balneolaceae bacterium]